jgi:HSP20 family protein
MANMRALAPFRDRAYLARPEFGLFGSLQREIDRMFDDLARSLPAVGQGNATLVPSIDISETENEILITAEMPGLERKDVEITVEDDVLTIRGEKKFETEQGNAQSDQGASQSAKGQNEANKSDKKADNTNAKPTNYHVTERSYGVFLRVLQLPTRIDPAKVEATMHNGVLKIRIPKQARPQANRIEVKEAA